MRAPGVKPWSEGSRCYFGRQHVWSTALAAALNSNEGAELPTEPEWVFWCSTCGTLGPWPVETDEDDACSDDPDGVHFVGCGCEA